MLAASARLLLRCAFPRCSALDLASPSAFCKAPAVRRALSELPPPRKISAMASNSSDGDRVRRHQEQLDEPTAQTTRGGPSRLEELKLSVISRSSSFVVLNKGADERLDGAFDTTIEKAVRGFEAFGGGRYGQQTADGVDVQLYRDFADVEKFRWIHQLDFGGLCVG